MTEVEMEMEMVANLRRTGMTEKQIVTLIAFTRTVDRLKQEQMLRDEWKGHHTPMEELAKKATTSFGSSGEP